MDRLKEFFIYGLIYIGGYELIRTLWIIVDNLQGYEYRFEVSDTITTTILTHLLARWLLKEFESEE